MHAAISYSGVNVGLIGLYEGCKVTVLPEVDPAEILRLIEDEKLICCSWCGVDFVCHATARYCHARCLQRAASERRIADCRNYWCSGPVKCDFVQVYGLTETTGGGTNLKPEDHDAARNKARSWQSPMRVSNCALSMRREMMCRKARSARLSCAAARL